MAFSFIVLALACGLGALAKLTEITTPRRHHTVSEKPTCSVRELRPGSAAVVRGKITCEAPLRSPLDATDCVFFDHMSYDAPTFSGALKRHASHLVDGTTFFVDDGSGRIAVDPKLCEIHAPMVQADGHSQEQRLRVGQEVTLSGTFETCSWAGPYRGDGALACAPGSAVNAWTEPSMLTPTDVLPAFLRAASIFLASLAVLIFVVFGFAATLL